MKWPYIFPVVLLLSCGADDSQHDSAMLFEKCQSAASSMKPWLETRLIPALEQLEEGAEAQSEVIHSELTVHMTNIRSCYANGLLDQVSDPKAFYLAASEVHDKLVLPLILLEDGESGDSLYPKAVEWAKVSLENLEIIASESRNDS